MDGDLEITMKWSEDFKIGIPVIDSQHKRLFQLIDEVNLALKKGLRSSDVEKLIISLDQYKTRHFQLEEKYMLESTYPGLAEQQKAHAHFTNKFNEISNEISQTGMTPALVQAITVELVEWLKEHVTGLDLEFGRFYKPLEKNQ